SSGTPSCRGRTRTASRRRSACAGDAGAAPDRRFVAQSHKAMSWPRDNAKLDRVQAAMAEEDVDALVVRAPDNVLYLSNFLPMKGYDVVVFPRDGEPTLIALEPSLEDAQRMAWTEDIRLFKGYADDDPRPPTARALDTTLA